MKAYWVSGGIAARILNLGTRRRWVWSASCTGSFTPKERAPGTHWIGGWVGLKACLDPVVKRKVLGHLSYQCVMNSQRLEDWWRRRESETLEIPYRQRPIAREDLISVSCSFNQKGGCFIWCQSWIKIWETKTGDVGTALKRWFKE
jgi:hypothetical protein